MNHNFLLETRPIFTTESPGTCPGPEWLTYGSYCYRIG